MGIISDIANATILEISRDKDWEITTEYLTDIGWHKVRVPFNFIDPILKQWLQDHIQGRYYFRHFEWIFEDIDDVTIFMLKWA